MKRSREDEGDDFDNNDEGTHNGEDHEDEDENQCWDDDAHEDEADGDIRKWTTMTITTTMVMFMMTTMSWRT